MERSRPAQVQPVRDGDYLRSFFSLRFATRSSKDSPVPEKRFHPPLLSLYGRWVQMLAGMYRGPGREKVAWNSALLYDMIFTQPVIYELDQLTMPVLLMIGDKDTTAIGKNLAPPPIRSTLGNYPALGKAAAARIPHVRLLEFPDLGHAPQIQAPAAFHKAPLDGLQMPALVASGDTR